MAALLSIGLILSTNTVALSQTQSNPYVASQTITTLRSSSRLSGTDRFQTAKTIAENVTGSSLSSSLVIASGLDFPDALSGSVLAHKMNAPIILVNDQVSTSAEAFDFITNHVAKNATLYFAGGTGVIPAEFDQKLRSLGYNNMIRLGGADRYETSSLIANAEEVSKGTPIVLTYGENFPDALSISSFAAYNGWPILLVDSNTISDQIKTFIQADQPSQIYVVGGKGVIPDSLLSLAQSLAPNSTVSRLSGSDRFETNAVINSEFATNPQHFYVASGLDFPDALAGSVLAAKTGDPILLVGNEDSSLNTSLSNYLKTFKTQNLNNITVFGGIGAVADAYLQSITALLDGTVTPEPAAGVVSFIVPPKNTDSYSAGYQTAKSYGNPTTWTIEMRFTVTNKGSNTGSTTITDNLPSPADTFIQKPVFESVSVDRNATLSVVEDTNGTEKAIIQADNVVPGEVITVTNKFVVEVRGVEINPSARLIPQTIDTSLVDTQYVNPEKFIESDDPDILTVAQDLKNSSSGTLDLVQKTHEFVYNTVAYDETFSSGHDNKGALSALTYKTGVCQDYADLEVALLRANQIPARVASGYALSSGAGVPVIYPLLGDGWSNTGGAAHAWVETYLPPYGWIASDPTWADNISDYRTIGSIPDNGHVTFDFNNNSAYRTESYFQAELGYPSVRSK